MKFLAKTLFVLIVGLYLFTSFGLAGPFGCVVFLYVYFFKIKKTLPEIEKYQNQNPLKIEELKKMVENQNQLLEKLKNMK